MGSHYSSGISVRGAAPEAFGEETPLVLQIKVRAKPGAAPAYLDAAAAVDMAMLDSTPGLLHHTVEQFQTRGGEFDFCSTMLFRNDATVIECLNTPEVVAFFGKFEDLLDDVFLEIYGTVGDRLRGMLNALPYRHDVHETQLGFSRAM